MSRDTNGTYRAPSNSWSEAVEGTVIDETEWNETLADIEDALTDSLSRSGKGTISKHIDFDENGSPGTPASNVGRLYVGDAGGATTLYFKDSSGNVTNLLLGAAGIAFSFDTSTTTNADPGDGDIRFNHASPASVTEIAIDDLNAAAADISAYINAIAVGSSLYIQKRSDPATFIVGTVLSVSDESGYTEIGFDYVDHNGTFVASDPLGVLVLPPGDDGTAATVTVGTVTTLNPGEPATVTNVGTSAAAILDFGIPAGEDGLGTGDVTAASNFGTDNRLIRSDGTSKDVQASGITVDDSNNVSGIATITVPNTGLHLLDTDASHDLIIAPGSDLSADRTLTVTTGDADRTLTISASATVSQDYSSSGNPQFATVELGHATDTTLTRSAAGELAVEGVLVKKVGKETIAWPAGAMIARTTNGAAYGTVEMTTNKNMFRTLDFDTTTQEFAQFAIPMPKSWDRGTITAAFVWSHPSTTTNFGVVWALEAVAISDDDAGDVAFGTAQQIADTGGTTNDIYITGATPAITVAGSPAAEDWVMFQVKRVPSDGSDTLAVDARLHGVKLYITTSASTDA